MSKNFEDLTIVDDYMFCTVMQEEALCKPLLEMVLKNKIGGIIKIIHQKPITNQIGIKGIRLDLMIEDDTGKIYDVEMQTTDQKNLPKRMRYYQCAIDGSKLNKGSDYNDLPDTFIIFFCTFDYLNKNLPVYTIQPMCKELSDCVFNDGTTKLIINSKAADSAEPELKAFLQYMNNGKANNSFTKKIEERIIETKNDETRRREYMMIQSFEMDARRAGREEGRSEGFSDGVRQKALDTAKLLKQFGDSVQKIMQATGLSEEEIEKL